MLSRAATFTAEPPLAEVCDPPATGAFGQRRVGQLHLDVLDRQAERLGGDLRQDRVRPGAQIVGGGVDHRPAFGQQPDFRLGSARLVG